ncbi:MAG: VanZ family protein [Alphaproteobacteria bacterium]
MRSLFWFTATTACLLLLLPGSIFPDIGFQRGDLIVHMVMMAGVTGLGIIGYERYRLPMVTGLATVALLSEIAQFLVPYRYFDPTDLAANLVGVIIGLMAGIAVTPIVLKRRALSINN